MRYGVASIGPIGFDEKGTSSYSLNFRERRMPKPNEVERMKQRLLTMALFSAPFMLSSAAQAQLDAGTLEKGDVAYNKKDYSPFVDRHVPATVFWGDTHVHSSI
jgi:hypothetical protein